MKKLVLLGLVAAVMTSCGGDPNSNSNTQEGETVNNTTAPAGDVATYDPKRGEGKFTNVDVGSSLDVSKVAAGEKVYEVKCSGCHKLTDEKLVGPGWAGVSTRHTPEWIMNFVTNTDAMIDKDPKVQAQLELCLVRMPNQNIADDEARNLVEFMRKNDGVK